MMRHLKIIPLLIASCFFLAIVIRADNDKFPDGPGKATFLKVCSQCHTVESIAMLRYSRDEWKDLVYNMKDMGAEATDQECDAIIDYLFKNFPREEKNRKV